MPEPMSYRVRSIIEKDKVSCIHSSFANPLIRFELVIEVGTAWMNTQSLGWSVPTIQLFPA